MLKVTAIFVPGAYCKVASGECNASSEVICVGEQLCAFSGRRLIIDILK